MTATHNPVPARVLAAEKELKNAHRVLAQLRREGDTTLVADYEEFIRHATAIVNDADAEVDATAIGAEC